MKTPEQGFVDALRRSVARQVSEGYPASVIRSELVGQVERSLATHAHPITAALKPTLVRLARKTVDEALAADTPRRK